MNSNNKGYGSHPTIYGRLSDTALFSMYRGETWFSMDEGHRQQLLQETVNRAAAANGELGSCKVVFGNLSAETLGQQSGNEIVLNRSILAKDLQEQSFHGHVIREFAADSNMRALETVLHEDIHAWQNQCINGDIPCKNQALLQEYQANNFTVSQVPDENGTMQNGLHYLCGETAGTGYYLYYFQSTERDAHFYSERQTMKIMGILENKFGTEKSFETYQNRLSVSGFDVQYRNAKEIFGNKNFEKEINNTLKNQYYGTNIPVSPEMQKAVKNEMALSYQASMRQSNDMKGEKQMTKTDNGFEYTPATLEDYDEGMRDTVNAFYTHAMNDPNMTQEEAIAQTAEMSEKYLDTMDELNEAHERGEIMSENDLADAQTGEPGVENGTENGGGLNDDDGGIDDDDGGLE